MFSTIDLWYTFVEIPYIVDKTDEEGLLCDDVNEFPNFNMVQEFIILVELVFTLARSIC